MLSDVWFILLSQAFVEPVLLFFDMMAIKDVLIRWWIRFRIKAGKSTKTQEEVQKKWQLSEFDPASAYSTFAKTVIVCVFYQPILPLGVPLGLLAVLIMYYGYMKKLVYDSATPVMISDSIAKVTLYLLNLVPFAYAVAHL